MKKKTPHPPIQSKNEKKKNICSHCQSKTRSQVTITSRDRGRERERQKKPPLIFIHRQSVVVVVVCRPRLRIQSEWYGKDEIGESANNARSSLLWVYMCIYVCATSMHKYAPLETPCRFVEIISATIYTLCVDQDKFNSRINFADGVCLTDSLLSPL